MASGKAESSELAKRFNLRGMCLGGRRQSLRRLDCSGVVGQGDVAERKMAKSFVGGRISVSFFELTGRGGF